MDLSPENVTLWNQFLEEFSPAIWQQKRISSPERFAPQIQWRNGKAVHYTFLSQSIEPGYPGRVWAWFERHFDQAEPLAQTPLIVTRAHYAPEELETTDLRMVYALRRRAEVWAIYPDMWFDYLKPKL